MDTFEATKEEAESMEQVEQWLGWLREVKEEVQGKRGMYEKVVRQVGEFKKRRGGGGGGDEIGDVRMLEDEAGNVTQNWKLLNDRLLQK